MKYVFGPVPSRRLGQSLGIDPVPFKTCNWNCVYCQLGRTTSMTTERADFHPVDEIVAETKTVLDGRRPGDIDWITLVGSGEPTLHTGIGRIIREVKALTDIPLSILTNGSFLYLPEIREDLLPADAVLPSLDAGSKALYRKINRPIRGLTFERLIEGLITFRRVYAGKLWIEVMLIKGANDTQKALTDLADVLREIAPDEVHIALPTRPPAEPWVEPPDESGLVRAAAILGEIARVVPPAEGVFDLSGYDHVVDAVLSIITRHPMREDQLVRTLDRWAPGQVTAALEELAADGRAGSVTRYGHRFWSSAGARYIKQKQS